MRQFRYVSVNFHDFSHSRRRPLSPLSSSMSKSNQLTKNSTFHTCAMVKLHGISGLHTWHVYMGFIMGLHPGTVHQLADPTAPLLPYSGSSVLEVTNKTPVVGNPSVGEVYHEIWLVKSSLVRLISVLFG